MMNALVRSAILAIAAASSTQSGFVRAAEFQAQPLEKSDVVLILVHGEIKAGDETTFRDLALKYEKAWIVLDSPGGAVGPALEIGRAVHLKEFSTVVSNESLCTSACALIWLAGAERYLSKGGRLGFHASYKTENGVALESGLANAMVGHYLSQMNMPARAVAFATVASPTQILWLDDETREASGITYKVFPDTDAVNADAAAPPPSQAAVTARPAPPLAPVQPAQTDMGAFTELAQYPKAWLEKRSAENGLDVTLDGKVWINADHYGDRDDYAVAASDLLKASGRYRKAWIRGYHIKNPDVAYRESKQLVRVDCDARTMMTELEAAYDPNGHQLWESGTTPWKPVIPGTYQDTWLTMLCE